MWEEGWFYILNFCLIPGKLFWNREPEELGPALPAAVSIPGPLRLGRMAGVSTVHSGESLCPFLAPDHIAQAFPFVFPIGTMQYMTLETGKASLMPTMMGPAAH
jgi:hypothetical protein